MIPIGEIYQVAFLKLPACSRAREMRVGREISPQHQEKSPHLCSCRGTLGSKGAVRSGFSLHGSDPDAESTRIPMSHARQFMEAWSRAMESLPRQRGQESDTWAKTRNPWGLNIGRLFSFSIRGGPLQGRPSSPGARSVGALDGGGRVLPSDIRQPPRAVGNRGARF